MWTQVAAAGESVDLCTWEAIGVDTYRTQLELSCSGGLLAAVGYCPRALQALGNCIVQHSALKLGCRISCHLLCNTLSLVLWFNTTAMYYLSQFLSQESKGSLVGRFWLKVSSGYSTVIEAWRSYSGDGWLMWLLDGFSSFLYGCLRSASWMTAASGLGPRMNDPGE